MIKKMFKLHLNLIRYLYKELRKKKSPKTIVYFLFDLLKQYIKIMLQEVNNLFRIFDPSFRKAKKKYEKTQKIKVDLRRALHMLRFIDKRMKQQGKNRQERRAFWNDFVKSEQIRNEVFEDLERELR